MASRRGWVLVTGASGGIGGASTAELSRAGYNVLAAVRDPGKWSAPAHQGPGLIEPLRLDLLSDEKIEAAMLQIDHRCREDALVGLVNNAGIALPSPFETQRFGDALAQIRTNVAGPLRLTQLLLPRLRRSKGCIISVSSLAGRLPMPFNAVHCGTKHFIEGMFESLRVELAGTGVRVVIVEPGPIRTPMATKFTSGVARALSSIPAGAWPVYGPRFGRGRKADRRTGRRSASADALRRRSAGAAAPPPRQAPSGFGAAASRLALFRP